VILRRDDGQVYLARRSRDVSFFPGFHAFPGGAVEDEDGPAGADDTDLTTLRECAAREAREELRVDLEPETLEPAGVATTPPFSPIRFRNQYFLAPAEGVDPDPQPPELAGGAWTRPADAVAAWRTGEAKLPPPVLHALQVLVEEGPAALRAVGTSEHRFPITFLPGLRVEPLEVGTLPPHTHTNAFVVGEDELAVVDPGGAGDALDPLLETLAALDGTVTTVALTHHHEDHVAGATELVDRFGARAVASPGTADRLDLDVDRRLADGDAVDLGDHRLEALATPGHAPGHSCYVVPEARTLLAGDLVAGVGTVLVPPGEGDMADYMASLGRAADICRDRELRLAFPAHGPPLFGPVDRLQATLDHRREREARVLDALGEAPRELATVAKRAYEDKPDAPAELTHASTRAHLAKLEDESRAVREGETWRRA
jgi:glyoxylase-like metal-dependent hydrolase (beta-lactamase superfamily II)/8-oxo-dGTP pyrophosphatase MutT (NUDIX family)